MIETLILQAATLLAAFFQSATGIGFGMIAGPVILIVLDDPAAVVISTAMSWLIALCLFPGLRRGTDLAMLGRLSLGAALGILPGLALLATVDIETLKLLAGVVIGLLTALIVFGAPGMTRPGLGGDLIAGALGGLFGGCLAMPGPTAAIRMNGLGFEKRTVRATMVSFFVCIWPIILLGQWLSVGVSAETANNALRLVPATLAGLVLGNYAAARLGETLFRRMVIAFLVLTSVSLIAGGLW
ncbi:MAG: sulfite exporter TauE/SafE family protein [Pseudomonadota bacterium]